MSMNDVSAQQVEDMEDMFPITVAEIAEEHRKDRHLRTYFNLNKPNENARFKVRIVSNTDVILDEKGCLVITRTLSP